MRGGVNSIMRKAQKMQSQIKKIQEEIGNTRVEASAGGGVVTAVVNGNSELLELRMDPEVVDPEEIEMLQEMVIIAVNQAMTAASDMMNTEVEKVTGGLNLPGLF